MLRTRLEEFTQGGYAVYRVPSMICTDKGTLIMACECRHGGDWGVMDQMIRRSFDGGKTWTDREMIYSSKGIDVINNGVLFADGDTVHMLFAKNFRNLYYIKSTDEGETWTEPKDISYAVDCIRDKYNWNWTVFAPGPGHGMVTSSGRLIIPAWVVANITDINAHTPSHVTTIYSDDHGETWNSGELIYSTEGFLNPNESVLAELSDGSFMINCRHMSGTNDRKVGYSPDGISGWHGFFNEKQLTDPTCAAGMTQGEGAIWFTNCDCTTVDGRINLRLKKSYDDGKTWNTVLDIAKFGGYSDCFYSSKLKKLFVIAEEGRKREYMFSFGLTFYAFDENEI